LTITLLSAGYKVKTSTKIQTISESKPESDNNEDIFYIKCNPVLGK